PQPVRGRTSHRSADVQLEIAGMDKFLPEPASELRQRVLFAVAAAMSHGGGALWAFAPNSTESLGECNA
ncbi:MAG: hypothetical protein WA085_18980, partial [Sphingobium sp.]